MTPAASSTAPMTRAPRARARSSTGRPAGTAGESTISSGQSKSASACREKGTRTLRPSGRSSSALRSVARTSTPWLASSSIEAIPDFSRPMTRAFFTSMNGLPQFEGGEREQRQHQPRDPETHDDLGFLPAERLEVVMQRRHLEDPLAAQLEAAHLQHHRERIHHENAADEDQQDFLLDEHGNRGHPTAKPQRAH